MGKSKKKHKQLKQSFQLVNLLEPLDIILAKRNGGAINIRGIHYQILYACLIILQKLHENSDTIIRLEGIEDLDVNTPHKINDNEYVQLKTSDNKLDAGTFWNMGVLQNFLEIYKLEPHSRFRLVYNMNISDGNLDKLINNSLNDKSLEFWLNKLKSLDYKGIDYNHFLSTISFEQISITEMSNQILKDLYTGWHINKGTENQFLQSLFYNVLIWSKERVSIKQYDIRLLFQEVLDSYSKAPVNEAVKNNWIKPVIYSTDDKKDYTNYYDGKSAMPIHIAEGLPARRNVWEKNIESKLESSDIVLIKSSSGQGKSTLAWQVGYNLKERYVLYQIQYCTDWNTVNSITSFIESRVAIGQLPLIIFDGLNSLINYWSHVVENTAHLPVKYILTSRNEDWHRYGADISHINLQIIDINLSTEEAKDIYTQLKNRNRIHKDILSWQAIWEQIRESGLLIEYTYLLTRGEMLRERLSHQIKNLNRSQGAYSKIEILRLVSLADCMNIRMRTSRIIEYISSTIGFQEDRGEILKELENEYFLNFETFYISGLHPVRSAHLKDLLHQSLPIGDSLINLYQILEDTYKHDYFINIPLLLISANREEFYNKLAKVLSQKDFSDMVIALDGIFHIEPQIYWERNKQIFNDAFGTGGIDLFSMTTIPFRREAIKELDNFVDSLGSEFSSNLNYLSQRAKELPFYTIKESDVYIFASCLQTALKHRKEGITSFSGLEFLMKWFNVLQIPLVLSPDILSNIRLDYFINNIYSYDLQEAKEIALYFQNSDFKNYKKLIQKKQVTIIGYLKEKTDSLTIQVKKENININYLLFGDNVSNANELSVERIQTIYTFLPFYKKYCTEAILLPFPSEEMVSTAKQNSITHLSPDNIYNSFDVHLNQIWYTSILKNYEEVSVYDWQKGIILLRKEALHLILYCSQLIDSSLEGNRSKMQSFIKKLTDQNDVWGNMYSTRKKYPSYNKKYFEKQKDSEDEKIINSWLSSLANVNNQLSSLFIPKTEHDRHIALINLKDVYLELEKMQLSFGNIESKSFQYFDSATLNDEERAVYERLYITMQYYLSRIPLEDKAPIQVAKKVAKDWWDKEKMREMQDLHDILDAINTSGFNYDFYYPIKFEETSTLRTVTIGIGNIDFTDTETLNSLFLNLSTLADCPSNFYEIINIQNGVAINGLRFQREYFQKIKDFLSGSKVPNLTDLFPFPVFPDEKNLQFLPNITLPNKTEIDITKENKASIILELWKLSEYRLRLDRKNEFEKKWLNRTELDFRSQINNLLSNVDDYSFTNWVNKALNGKTELTTKAIFTQLTNL